MESARSPRAAASSCARASYETPFARRYQVVEKLAYREKQLKAVLLARGLGRLTIKKRGVQMAPEQLREWLTLTGDDEAAIVLTRVAGEGSACASFRSERLPARGGHAFLVPHTTSGGEVDFTAAPPSISQFLPA